jgi:diguanylate cyclase (GGDEF)-like protein
MDAYSSGSMASLFAFYLILAAVPIFNLWEIILFLNIPNLLTIGVMALDLLTIKEAIYTILIYEFFAIAMSMAFHQTYFRLLDAEKKLEAARDQLETMSITDPLTGLLNRYGLDHFFCEFKNGKQKIETVTAFAMDIDFFKDYNDAFGHLVGDECLVRIANAINFVFVGEKAKIARIGGDEFVVLLTNADEKKIKNIMDKLYKSVGELSISAGNQSVSRFLTVSCGIATANLNNLSCWTDLFAMADQVLYQMKNNGRNQYVIQSHKS